MDREYMGKVNSYCQRHEYVLTYTDARKTGPSHDPEFTVVVKINNVEYGTGTGKNKKEAKAVAAKETWEMIEREIESPSNIQAPKLTTTPVTSPPVPPSNYVSLLNEYSQKTSKRVDYSVQTRSGAAHAPTFSCICTINGDVFGTGTGPTIGAARQVAAKEAYEKLMTESTLTVYIIISYHRNRGVYYKMLVLLAFQRKAFNIIICFEESAEELVEKVKDMAVGEKPACSQKDAQRPAQKPRRKLAANFDNLRNKQEEKKMSDSDDSLPDLDANINEENGSSYTVNKRFLRAFKNIKPIGKGGFGNVFKATEKIDKRTCAIKRVRFTSKVMREVEELARLDHENIVRYYCSWKGYDCLTSPDSSQKSEETLCVFIQMELCEQGSLVNWIEKNRQEPKYNQMAENKFLQILEGVKYIHSKELIHRDLKPHNIFVSYQDKVKIGDFGLVTSVTYETLTENRGTKSYMAPEQFGDKYGEKVDIYALGLIWFEILSAFTSHEKCEVWSDARKGQLPEDFTNRF
ncbi:E2AK2 kinase, partial [Psophia crepitans]|nr:E2AK2 kinase [Psophia crepitans]